MTSECAHVVVSGDECVDCCEHVPEPADAEKWKNGGQGECVGCGRTVKNTFTKGRGKACLACLWGAWAN